MLFELVVCCLVLQLFGACGGVLDLGGVWGVSIETTLLLFVVLTPGVDLLLWWFQP